jgi:hypothetical protein
MKKLLKYTLINGQVPSEIEDGGYFYNDPYLYGISIHLEESYTPEGMTWVSQEEFDELITAHNTLTAANPDPTMEFTPLTRAIFESNHVTFSYHIITPKDRITALEDIIAELLEGA